MPYGAEAGGRKVVRIESDKERQVYTFSDEATFPVGSADLKEDAQHLLALVLEPAWYSNRLAIQEIQVIGHTDNKAVGRRSGFRDNWALGANGDLGCWRMNLL